jgi:SAM-dependent methyltransferase
MSAAAGVPRRSRAWDVLDNPWLWETSRVALDIVFGLYRRRLALLRELGLLEHEPSLLDVGCGIGQYAGLTGGEYLGIDLNPRYIEYAARRHQGAGNRSFRAAAVESLTDAHDHRRFDLVLMVDFLHHLGDAECIELLTTSARLARRALVSLEPVAEQSRRLGAWIVEHDRGDHMRPLERYEGLFGRAGLEIERSEPLMLGPISTRVVICRPPGSGHEKADSEVALLGAHQPTREPHTAR